MRYPKLVGLIENVPQEIGAPPRYVSYIRDKTCSPEDILKELKTCPDKQLFGFFVQDIFFPKELGLTIDPQLQKDLTDLLYLAAFSNVPF
jgi:hypothetical protein